MPHLLLQLKDTEHECLGGGRAARNVDIHRHNAVASSDNAVAVVVVAATVGAATHGDDPSGLGHLIVDLAKGGRHLVGEGAGDNHDVGLARRGTEDDSHAILIVTGCGQVHHLNSAAGKTEGHGPQRALARPVGNLVECGAER
jgi:predicted metal-dependent phosphoesterase TrpH